MTLPCIQSKVYQNTLRLKDDGTSWAPLGIGRWVGVPLSRRVDNGMGDDGTEDGTAWADVQAIQLFPMWMGRKVSNCIGEVLYG